MSELNSKGLVDGHVYRLRSEEEARGVARDERSRATSRAIRKALRAEAQRLKWQAEADAKRAEKVVA
ncbi:MAG: hypothetical protein QM723_40615 [Myxococcaceae bacterium]